MESFLKPFVERGVVYSLNKLPKITDENAETDTIKFLQKIIFKHDVVVEFKVVLNSFCFSEVINAKSETIKKLIKELNLLLLSDENVKTKIDICRYLFLSYSVNCKGEDVHVVQFFLLLSHLLGLNSIVQHENTSDDCILKNTTNFSEAFNVQPLTPSSESFLIFKELLLCLSKTPLQMNSLDFQAYNKWMHQLIKCLVTFTPFFGVFLELFLILGDIDFKLLENNLETIFSTTLTQEALATGDLNESYAYFLENALNSCVKYQRTVKFLTKFLSSIKTISTSISKDIVIPANFLKEFSKAVVIASNQQSLSIFEILVQNLDECFKFISNNDSESVPLLLYVVSELLCSFLAEVKLFAPSIASTTLLAFIKELNNFKSSVQKFGCFLFERKSVMLKNDCVVEIFLKLSFYCGEVQAMINCYKDFILLPSDDAEVTSDYDWQCCINLDQWNKLMSLLMKSKLEICRSIAFQLALQKVRLMKLQSDSVQLDESTVKIIMYQMSSEYNKFNAFKELPPEDLTLLLSSLTSKQCRAITRNIFKQILKSEKCESNAWILNPNVQENSSFIVSIFSELLREIGSIFQDVANDKSIKKVGWLLEEYFDKENSVNEEILNELPEKINYLLRDHKKIRKSVGKHLKENEFLERIFEIFKLLPIPYVKDVYRRLGLSFAVGMGILLVNEDIAELIFQSIFIFLSCDTDPSVCFNIGLCINWLNELSFKSKVANDLKVKIIESLIRNSPNTKFGLAHIGELVDSAVEYKSSDVLKLLENRLIVFNELGKCWQRAKKRKADNDLVGHYRYKLAKIISEEAKELEEKSINSENSKILFKVFSIELNKTLKTKDEEIKTLTSKKLIPYFDFAVKNLKNEFNESTVTFLAVILQSMAQLRELLPEGSLNKIWKAVKVHDKFNWKLFCSNSNEEEFCEILKDLVKISSKFLSSGPQQYSSSCFEMWRSFFTTATGAKKNLCQTKIQEFFEHIHDCDLLLKNLSIEKKIILVKFFHFCLNNKEVIVTSEVLDTIIHVVLECVDDSCSLEDFQNLFTAEVEVASAILLRQFSWNRSKVHLNFIIFKRLLSALMTRCSSGDEINADDVFKLSTCAFFLEKWVSLMVKKEKDFARISAYFLTILVSFIASVTVLPAVKIHLTNCINHFLSISDSHTVSYLLRLLKPGYQQVFNTMYNQFKKYHKYSGKI